MEVNDSLFILLMGLTCIIYSVYFNCGPNDQVEVLFQFRYGYSWKIYMIITKKRWRNCGSNEMVIEYYIDAHLMSIT